MVVLPSRTEEVPPSTRLAGLPLLRRIVLAAGRAGFGRVLVGCLRSEDQPLLAGTCAGALRPNGPTSVSARRIVLLPMNVVPQPSWLRQLREIELEPDRLYVDQASVAVVEATDPARVVAVAARCGSAADVVATLRGTFKAADRAFDEKGRFPLASLRDIPAAETWLLRSLIKQHEGFMSRHLERRISLALTRRLVTTRITPNAMTVVSVAIGLVGAPFFLSSAPAYQLAGALLFLTHSIVDGCDGEIARLKFLESAAGAVLDFWGDNLVHAAVFTCLAVGWSLDTGTTWPPLLGGIAVASTLGSAAVVYGRGLRASHANGETSRLSRLADALSHRDFIYVILLLAAAGKAAWFLVIAAAGAPIYLLLLAWIGRTDRGAAPS